MATLRARGSGRRAVDVGRCVCVVVRRWLKAASGMVRTPRIRTCGVIEAVVSI